MQHPWPTQTTCIAGQAGGAQPAMAKELVVAKTRTVLFADGPRAISDANWADYRPPLGTIKNADRHLHFSTSCFSRSPSAPADCEGEACKVTVEHDGYSWLELSQIEAMDCLSEVRCSMFHPRPGQLQRLTIQKCHRLEFVDSAWFLHGPGGERAVLHATPTPTFDPEVELPPGWSVHEQALAEPLVVTPAVGPDAEGCYYHILRDAKLQAYHLLPS